MKVSQRNLFGLTLEISNENQSMINEAMLKYYLNKCLKLDKDKFRFIGTEEQQFAIDQKSVIQKSNENVTIVKILIEIIDDQENIDQYFKIFKNQIRQGTSLLYDLQPLVFTLNLGQNGLNYNSSLSDFHLVKKKGVIIGEEEYLISVMRHMKDPLSFKVFAVNFEKGEEYQLDLQSRDIFELTEGNNSILEKQEPSELIDLIIDNLVIITKDGVKLLSCEHKIFFNSLFINKYAQNNKGTMVDNFMSGNPFRNTAFRNQQILEKIQTKSNTINPDYNSSLRQEMETQTDFDPAIIYESFIPKYQGNQRIGKQLEFKMTISQGKSSKTIMILMEEIRSRQKCQICFFDNEGQINSKEKENYVIYSECIKICDSQMILITFEKVQKDGFLVKIHDLKELASEEFFLVKKSNGQYTKLNRSAGLDLVFKEEFRNLIFDLTFAVNIPSSQVLIANMAYHTEQQQNMIKTSNEIFAFDSLLSLPTRKRNNKAVTTQKQLDESIFKAQATIRNPLEENQQNALIQKLEKGELLYRNVFIVRCSFEGSEEHDQQSLISFYIKKDLISVDVFLYKDQQKMSIASQVSQQDLFGPDYNTLSFSQKIQLLDLMMEKLYVLSENQQYHLKVENEATPISQILDSKKQVLSQDSNNFSMTSNKDLVQAQNEIKLKEIKDNKNEALGDGKALLVTTYAQIDGQIFEYKAYYMLKLEKDSTTQLSPKKRQSMMKKQLEKHSVSIEAMLEDSLDFESIYIEINDKQNELYSALLTQKTLIQLLAGNPQIMQKSWNAIVNRDKEVITNIIKAQTFIDKKTNTLKVNTCQPGQEFLTLSLYNEVGGIYIRRGDKFHKSDLEQQLFQKKLIMNQEFDMSEFIYDIKLYQILDNQQEKLISYSLEIFALNDPDTLYRFNYPFNKQSSTLHSPMHTSIDIINLIESPIKDLEKQLLQKDKPNFQDLFSKYIDNRLLLVVNEQIFPQKISFCVIEPSSSLQWQFNFDPLNEDLQFAQNSLAVDNFTGINILDQGTIEQYLALLFNDYKNQSKNLEILQFDNREDLWVDIGSDNENPYIEQFEILKNKMILEDLNMSLFKIGTDGLKIQINNVNNTFGTQSNNNPRVSSFTPKGEAETPSKISPRIHRQDNASFTLIVNTTYKNKFISKIIKLQDKEQLLLLKCQIKERDINIKVIQFNSTILGHATTNQEANNLAKVLFSYRFRDKNEALELEKEQKKWEKIEESIDRALSQIFNSRIIERSKNIEQSINNKFNNEQVQEIYNEVNPYLIEEQSVTQKRKALKKSQIKPLILHRKTFFDEGQEKLIIVAVMIECAITMKKGVSKSPANTYQYQECSNPIDSFKLIINEPETQKILKFSLHLDQCFNEEELQGVNRYSITQLKKLAKILVEERAVIKRISDDNNPNDKDQPQNVYTVEINIAATANLQNNYDNQSTIEAASGTIEEPKKNQQINLEDTVQSLSHRNSNNPSQNRHQENINEIHEEDEENEEDEESPNQNTQPSKQRNNLQQSSIIEEQVSQEEVEDSPQLKKPQSRLRPGQGSSENNSQQRESQQIEEYMDSMNDEMMESVDSVIYEKQLPKDQVFEIISMGDGKYLVRKRSQLDNIILQEQIIDDELIKNIVQMIGVKSAQDEVYEIIADYILQTKQFK